jgi:hypothetical protein
MNRWTAAVWGVGIVAGLYASHRLALWLEREGWIRYVRNPPRGGDGAGAALGELQQFFEPRTKHVYELKREERPRREADGGDPAPTDPGP